MAQPGAWGGEACKPQLAVDMDVEEVKGYNRLQSVAHGVMGWEHAAVRLCVCAQRLAEGRDLLGNPKGVPTCTAGRLGRARSTIFDT